MVLTDDLRQAARSLRRSPGAMLFAVAALAIGIASTVAVFSVVDRAIFRPLPYTHADRLVWLGMRAPLSDHEFLLEEGFHDLRTHQTVFDSVTSFSHAEDCDITENQPTRARCAYLAHNLLDTFGVPLQLGRQISAAEDTPNGRLTALISDGLWRTRYGADPAIAGRAIQIDGRTVEVVGVLPRDFELPNLYRADILLPQQLRMEPGVSRSLLTVFARLEPGLSLEQARSALEPVFQEMRKRVPPRFAEHVRFEVSGFAERQVRLIRPSGLAVLGTALLVLLIACFNTANLMLARLAARGHEWAVRSALGASRGRVARQLVSEGIIVSLAGATLGVVLAHPLLRFLLSLAPADLAPKLKAASIDTRIVAFALALALACGLLTSILPALRAPSAAALRTTTATGGFRLRQSMVAVQIALSCVLLSSAGLLLRSLWNLQHEDLGFRPQQVTTVEIQLPRYRYTERGARDRFFERAYDDIRTLPGIADAALTSSIPVAAQAGGTLLASLYPEGRPADQGRTSGARLAFRIVTPDYFRAMGIPILRGRGFTDSDRTKGAAVAIVDEALARRLFPGDDALGKRFRWGANIDSNPWYTVVGITRPARNATAAMGNAPEFYAVWHRNGATNNRTAGIVVRSTVDPAALGTMIRERVAAIDASLPVTVATMEQNVERILRPARLISFVITTFALAGMLLAALGQFGVISQLVTQRRREIGVRIAIGASPADAAGLVMRHALVWTGLGAVAGIAAAVAAARPLRTMLYGVESAGPLHLLGVAALLIAVSVAAAWRPAMRAASVDPVEALRSD